MMQFDKSVNIEKFKVWLDELRARHFLDDICLVMDNLSVHHSNAAIERIDELGFEYIFTPPTAQTPTRSRASSPSSRDSSGRRESVASSTEDKSSCRH